MRDKMNSVVNYTLSLTNEPFLYEETKVVVNIRLQGYTDKEIIAKVIKDNIWGYKSIKQAKHMRNVETRKRIRFLFSTIFICKLNYSRICDRMLFKMY